MDIQQLRDELTKRGIAFGEDLGQEELQALLDDALAEEAKTAEEAVRAAEEAKAREATAAKPEGKSGKPKPGKAKGAGPAGAAPSGAAAPAAGKPPEGGTKNVESPIEIEARKEIEAMKPAPLPEGFTEEQVLEKTRLGITRPQAITILTTQAEHDAALAAAEKKTGKA